MNQNEYSKESRKDNLENKNYKLKLGVKKLGAAVLVIGALAGGISGCKAQPESGSRADFFGKVDPSIESVTLEEGAKIRSNPNVSDKNDPSNILATIDQEAIIKAKDQIRLSEDPINGDWYGIPAEVIDEITPDSKVMKDKDGVVWVNSQKADIDLK